MTEILIDLPVELVKYLDENPYIGDRSKFIAVLIQKFKTEEEKSKREGNAAKNKPGVVIWDFGSEGQYPE